MPVPVPLLLYWAADNSVVAESVEMGRWRRSIVAPRRHRRRATGWGIAAQWTLRRGNNDSSTGGGGGYGWSRPSGRPVGGGGCGPHRYWWLWSSGGCCCCRCASGDGVRWWWWSLGWPECENWSSWDSGLAMGHRHHHPSCSCCGYCSWTKAVAPPWLCCWVNGRIEASRVCCGEQDCTGYE